METLEQCAIEAGDSRSESAIATRQFSIDAGGFGESHQRAGEAWIVEGCDEAVDSLDTGLAAIFETADIGELQFESAEVVTRGKMRGGDEVVDVSVAASAEWFEALGKIDHLAGEERVVEGEHRAAVGDRVDTELEREQHPHERCQPALYFKEVLRFLGDFRHR